MRTEFYFETQSQTATKSQSVKLAPSELTFSQKYPKESYSVYTFSTGWQNVGQDKKTQICCGYVSGASEQCQNFPIIGAVNNMLSILASTEHCTRDLNNVRISQTTILEYNRRLMQFLWWSTLLSKTTISRVPNLPLTSKSCLYSNF